MKLKEILNYDSLQDELVNLRAKLSEILEENKRLHEELKTSILQEIVGENIDLEAVEVRMIEICTD